MIFFFDFDHTLFDTTELRRDINRIFLEGGIKQKSFDASYKELAYGIGYDPNAQATLLAAEWRDLAARNVANRSISDLMKSARKYVFEGARELLEELKGSGHQLIVLTLGNCEWQRTKIVCSGLADLFDRMEIVPGPGRKASRLEAITDGHEAATVIDDNPGELEAVMSARSGFRCIYFRRPNNPYPNPGCEEVADISELRQLLRNV